MQAKRRGKEPSHKSELDQSGGHQLFLSPPLHVRLFQIAAEKQVPCIVSCLFAHSPLMGCYTTKFTSLLTGFLNGCVQQLKAGTAGLDYSAMTERAKGMTADAEKGSTLKQEPSGGEADGSGASAGAQPAPASAPAAGQQTNFNRCSTCTVCAMHHQGLSV